MLNYNFNLELVNIYQMGDSTNDAKSLYCPNIFININTYGIDKEKTFMKRSVGRTSCYIFKEDWIGIEEVWETERYGKPVITVGDITQSFS